MEKYVLTGGPGSGKSSILLSLEMQGEYVVREAAEDYIRLRQAQGQLTPWVEPDFQDKILDLQLERNKKIPWDIDRVFVDRGLLDGLAYVKEGTPIYKRIIKQTFGIMYPFFMDDIEKLFGKSSNLENADEDSKLSGVGVHYHKVFIIDPLSTIQKTAVRRENLDESLLIGMKLEKIYTLMCHHEKQIIHIKSGTLDDRVAEIMQHLD